MNTASNSNDLTKPETQFLAARNIGHELIDLATRTIRNGDYQADPMTGETKVTLGHLSPLEPRGVAIELSLASGAASPDVVIKTNSDIWVIENGATVHFSICHLDPEASAPNSEFVLSTAEPMNATGMELRENAIAAMKQAADCLYEFVNRPLPVASF